MLRKMFMVGVLVASATLGAPVALSAAATTSEPEMKGISVDLGERDFRTYCAACHGISGVGDGTIAEFLTIAAPDLTKLTKMNYGQFPRDRVIHVIDGRSDVKVHGTRDMPVWGDLFDVEAISPDTDRTAREIIVRERIESLVNYVETLQEN
jgi:mono/diheme cytochrome c family protein